MAKLISFTFITLDGYYRELNGGTSWHQHNDIEIDFLEDVFKSQSTLLFGRITYESFANFWPTSNVPEVFNPKIVKGMNEANKVVVSKTLKSADWNNSKIMNDDLTMGINKLKQTSSHDIFLLGSGTLLTQLADANLIDDYRIMIDPVVIGGGTSIFNDLKNKLELKLTKSRTFENGVILLHYKPIKLN